MPRRGLGAWYLHGEQPPRRARVSQRQPLSKALFVTSEVVNFDRTGRRAAYDRLQAAARLARTWGDGYGYLMVATGRADVMVDPIMALWDAAALAGRSGRGRRHVHRLAGRSRPIGPAKAWPPTVLLLKEVLACLSPSGGVRAKD